MRAQLANLTERCRAAVPADDLLHDYFQESVGILDRVLTTIEGECEPGDATAALLRDVHAMEAKGLLEFLEEELDVHARRKQLRYETVDAASAGLVGDGRTNNRPTLQRLLDAWRAQRKPIRLLFPPGDYFFADPARTAGGSIVLEDVEDLILEGTEGARLVTSGEAMAGDSIRMVRCRNVILRNLTLDMDPLPFVFGSILAKDDSAGTIDIELLPNSPAPDASYWRDGHEVIGSVTIRRAGTCHYIREAGNGLGASRVEPLGDRRYRMHLANAKMEHIPVGATAVWHPRGRQGCGQGLSLRHCRHVLLHNVRMHAAETVCVWPEYSGGMQFVDCDFAPPPDRPALVNADGFHVPRNLKGPYLERSRILGPADDCLNFYSPAFSVADWDPARRSLVLLVDFPGDAGEFFAPGDPVALMNSNTGVPEHVAGVLAAEVIDWSRDEPVEPLRCGKRALRLTLDRDVPGVLTRRALGRPDWSPYHEYWKKGSPAYEAAQAIDAPYEHLAVNLRYVNGGFILRHCRFGYNRALGFKCKAGSGVIRDSHFIGQALLFETSLVWREGFLPHDIEVTRTRIDWFCLCELGLLGRTVRGEEALRLMPRIRFADCAIGGQEFSGEGR